jgi:hypothetical protein
MGNPDKGESQTFRTKRGSEIQSMKRRCGVRNAKPALRDVGDNDGKTRQREVTLVTPM